MNKPSKFIKKPVTIEAIQITDSNGWIIEQWSNEKVVQSPVLEPTVSNPCGTYLQVYTLEGVMIAYPGDWIIKGVAGEFYPCKDNIFKLSYQLFDHQNCDDCDRNPCICNELFERLYHKMLQGS